MHFSYLWHSISRPCILPSTCSSLDFNSLFSSASLSLLFTTLWFSCLKWDTSAFKSDNSASDGLAFLCGSILASFSLATWRSCLRLSTCFFSLSRSSMTLSTRFLEDSLCGPRQDNFSLSLAFSRLLSESLYSRLSLSCSASSRAFLRLYACLFYI